MVLGDTVAFGDLSNRREPVILERKVHQQARTMHVYSRVRVRRACPFDGAIRRASSFARDTSLARWHPVNPPDWMAIVVVAV